MKIITELRRGDVIKVQAADHELKYKIKNTHLSSESWEPQGFIVLDNDGNHIYIDASECELQESGK